MRGLGPGAKRRDKAQVQRPFRWVRNEAAGLTPCSENAIPRNEHWFQGVVGCSKMLPVLDARPIIFSTVIFAEFSCHFSVFVLHLL